MYYDLDEAKVAANRPPLKIADGAIPIPADLGLQLLEPTELSLTPQAMEEAKADILVVDVTVEVEQVRLDL